MKRLLPSDNANLGKLKVAPQRCVNVGFPLASIPRLVHSLGELLSTSLVMSGCPKTRSAGAAVWVGMLFQIKTRLCPRSVTSRRFPSEVTDTGENKLLDVGVETSVVEGGAVLKFGSPRT